VPIFTDTGQDLTHLPHKENTQSDISIGQAKNFNRIYICDSDDSYNINHTDIVI
jgi:hypothetical protein